MTMNTYLAIDIGASSGRHMLGHLENGKLVYEEIHRFKNGMVKKSGQLSWDLDALMGEILHGLKRCGELGKIPESVGIDTWGVDFVLLDEHNQLLGEAVAYRDNRTEGMDREVYACMPEAELYRRTGIQKMILNTIYQLMAVKKKTPERLAQAKRLLMLPDYLHYLLCGVAANEYTEATTTGLVNAETKTWDEEILHACGYPREIFGELVPPGTRLGELTKEVQAQVGFTCQVVLPASHDTGSAVMAVPSLEEDTLYISSGTWSLLGVELLKPDCTPLSQAHNFTNEGGYAYRYRYLRNIMGLWMIQSVQKELGGAHSFGELCEMAAKETIASRVDCNHNRFLAPESMIQEIRKACAESGQAVPKEAGELAAVVYHSLAACYANTIRGLEESTGVIYPAIHIVGGGAHAEYLNQLTAAETGKTVDAGPTEATAIGNLMAQMITAGELQSLQDGRECVKRSFPVKTFVSGR